MKENVRLSDKEYEESSLEYEKSHLTCPEIPVF